MKVVKVICIILAVLTLLITLAMFGVKSAIGSEISAVKDGKESILKIETVEKDGVKYYKFNNEEMSEEKYIDTLDEAQKYIGYIAIGGVVVTVVFIAGAVGSGIAGKKKKD